MNDTTSALDVEWNHGTPRRARTAEPKIQIHWYDERTAILRQSKTVNYEAPFLYLLIGDERALLLDTGATADPQLFPLRATVDELLAQRTGDAAYPLVVAHSHGHNDHVAADPQFADRPATTIVGHDVDAVREFFGFGASWPVGSVFFELGGRELTVLGSPGHHRAAITIHDPRTGILLTGDTVLPGRLYAFDYPAFLATLDRLVAFAEEHEVSHVLGCHVEMRSEPGRDFPIGAGHQPGERAPQLTVAQLTQVRDAAHAVAARRGVHRFDDFLIYNQPRRLDMIKLVARGLAHKALRR
ncbi:MBL fold metallo-hydrolase [Micromonospora auratinigra]|uniref:Metallo-beta-lactamase superfamily protein n=1 Tax=Micromonospora auratinigra TaxID=261654 RepID=A0A1A8Z0M8_9ACTN|nr:MBL fold metallo-hydrolase [Micromonospora auratinigra]SBT37273.1 Metallo-beta-lactamase superfamily protein [Micromonospora auratinigra]